MSLNTAVGSVAQQMYENEGITCSCHLNPPCGFCVALDEEEANVCFSDGLAGLRRLWAARDETLGEVDNPLES